ncbi:NAD(P)-binding protein [Apiospora saccharicola]|uniref:NAD(P)-binding protein n=1 Tax=Apiospora saccharicola TaxID=335842 RepID=A0ABR1VED0_9PEZI
MSPISKVAVFGASGNFGTPITAALIKAGFDVTIFTRPAASSSTPTTARSTFPASAGSVVEVADYGDVACLTAALAGHEAVVSVLGPGAIAHEVLLVDAAEAAGVQRFIVNDFGWGQNPRSFPEMLEVGARRHVAWDRAKEKAAANSAFTWTGITIGNPIDWPLRAPTTNLGSHIQALRKFSKMGFSVAEHTAVIYDSGAEHFTGTTLEGIGQSVVGVLNHPEETANRFVKARSIKTCQSELLEAFQSETSGRHDWTVTHEKVADLLEGGMQKHKAGDRGWILDLLVTQLYEEGSARCVVAASREDSDAELLGIREETAREVAAKALGQTAM